MNKEHILLVNRELGGVIDYPFLLELDNNPDDYQDVDVASLYVRDSNKRFRFLSNGIMCIGGQYCIVDVNDNELYPFGGLDFVLTNKILDKIKETHILFI